MKTKYKAVEYKYNKDEDIWERTHYSGYTCDTLEEARGHVKRARQITDGLSTNRGYGEEPYIHHIVREKVKEPIDHIDRYLSLDREHYTPQEVKGVIQYLINCAVVTVHGE